MNIASPFLVLGLLKAKFVMIASAHVQITFLVIEVIVAILNAHED